ncbi:MAG: SPOR domain-containing protein [Candidatus Rokuibacteriota bacterium]
MTRRGRHAPSRVASALFVVGCLGVLGGTFTAGVMAGRFWPRTPAAPSQTAARDGAPARGADRTARPKEPTPTLTFYQDLTAPLTAPPPAKAAKPGRGEKAERSERPERPEKPEAVPKPERPAPEMSLPAPSQAAFTIQVGAYKAREPAEALRARLAAAGHDAYVAEIDASGSVRYRVRVGAFATREAAQLAADKIVAAERKVSAYVTAR